MPRTSRKRSPGRAGLIVVPSIAVGALIGSLITTAAAGGRTVVIDQSSAVRAAAPPLADGDAGDAPALSGGAMWYPWSPGPGELGANPQAFSYDQVLDDGRTAKKVITSWAQNEDSPDAPLKEGMAVAEDNGQIFAPYDALPTDFALVSSAKLRSGTVLAAGFIPISIPGESRLGIRMASSTDVADSWDTYTAPLIENKWKLSWYRIHRDLIELPDGTLLLGAYGQGTIDGVNKQYSLIFESSDHGKSWSQRSAVNAGSEYGTTELGFTRTSDGRLIAIMRGQEYVPRPPAQPMTQTFSDDDGKTWEPVKPFVPPAGMPNNGVMPQPMLQANGQLLLTYGRPDNNVVVSRDGTGRTWDEGEVLYSRYPGEDPLRRWMGSSGNMALVARNSSSSLAFGDTCHNIWFCREYGHDNAVWTKIIDAKGAGVGKIDLARKVADGTAKITGEVVPADNRYPEQRLVGAVDGSGGYRAAARFTDNQKLTIELDRLYTIEQIGLMMDTGTANSANIQVSVDGTAWSKPVIKTGASTDWAMRYHSVEPVKAKFIRVTPGAEAPLTAVTEIEVYAANILTFENDAVTTIPRGLKDTRYALVADEGIVDGYNHSRARLAIQDNDQTARGQATIVNPIPGAGQHLSFGFEGYGYGSGAIWEVLGTDAGGNEVVADRLHFSSDGNVGHQLKEWDGSQWILVGKAGPFVPNRSWLSIRLDSTADGTTATMNGTVMGTSSHRLAQVERFTGLRVMTGLNPEDVGNMEHSYDDVEFGTEADFGLPASITGITTTPAVPAAGETFVASAKLTNPGGSPATDVAARLEVPEGWQVAERSMPKELAPRASAEASWTVTAPASTGVGLYRLQVVADYTAGGSTQTGRSAPFEVGVDVQSDGVRTFDDEPAGQPPARTTTGGTVTIESVSSGGTTTQAVRVNDQSATAPSHVVFWQGSAAKRRYEFDLQPRATTQPTIVAIRGTGDTAFGVWRFLIGPESAGSSNGVVSAYNGKAWVRLGTIAGLHDRASLNHIVIEATTESASFTAAGTTLTTSVPASSATSITSLEVASSGAGAVGTDTYLDNLAMSVPG